MTRASFSIGRFFKSIAIMASLVSIWFFSPLSFSAHAETLKLSDKEVSCRLWKVFLIRNDGHNNSPVTYNIGWLSGDDFSAFLDVTPFSNYSNLFSYFLINGNRECLIERNSADVTREKFIQFLETTLIDHVNTKISGELVSLVEKIQAANNDNRKSALAQFQADLVANSDFIESIRKAIKSLDGQPPK